MPRPLPETPAQAQQSVRRISKLARRFCIAERQSTQNPGHAVLFARYREIRKERHCQPSPA